MIGIASAIAGLFSGASIGLHGKGVRRVARFTRNHPGFHLPKSGARYHVNLDPKSRECMRRQRQIERGILTTSNGLVA